MNLQDHIAEICLLGTQKRSIDLEQLPDALKSILLESEITDETEKVLTTLSFLHYYNLSGASLPSTKIDPILNPINESKPYISAPLGKALDKIKNIENIPLQKMLLSIWVNKTLRNDQIVAPAQSVAYFKMLVKTTASLRGKAYPTFGNKGNWLIEHDDNFENLRKQNKQSEDLWQFGTKEQRQSFISQVIKDDPAKALSKIKKGWTEENAREKLWILKLLKSNISPLFQDLFEVLYEGEFKFQEKESKTARACRLVLAQCMLLNPGSELHIKTMVKLKKYVVASKTSLLKKVFSSKSPLLNVPDSEDDFFNEQLMLKVYGIDVNETEAANFKTNPLYCFSKLVAALPFKSWSNKLNTNPKKLATFFMEHQQFMSTTKNNTNSSLQKSLCELAIITRDEKTILALLPYMQEASEIKPLLQSLTTQTWENVLLNSPEAINSEILKTYPTSDKQGWSLKFSSAVLKNIKKQILEKTTLSDYNLAQPCIQYLHLGAIKTLDQLNIQFHQNGQNTNYWQKHIYDPITEGLAIRKLIEQD